MSDPFFFIYGDDRSHVYFRIAEPGGVDLRTIEENLADFGSLSSLVLLLEGLPYEQWRQLDAQPQPRIERIRYGSPFEIVAQLTELGSAYAGWAGVGIGAVAAGQVLKHVRGAWRDAATGYRDFGEGQRARAEAMRAAAEAEEIRGRTLRDRIELQARRTNNPQFAEEIEVQAALPDFLQDAARELDDEPQEQLRRLAEEALRDQQMQAVSRGRSGPGRPSIRGLRERALIEALARLVLKDDVTFGRDEDDKP